MIDDPDFIIVPFNIFKKVFSFYADSEEFFSDMKIFLNELKEKEELEK